MKKIIQHTEGLNFAMNDIMQAHSYKDGILGYPQDLDKAKQLYPINRKLGVIYHVFFYRVDMLLLLKKALQKECLTLVFVSRTVRKFLPTSYYLHVTQDMDVKLI